MSLSRTNFERPLGPQESMLPRPAPVVALIPAPPGPPKLPPMAELEAVLSAAHAVHSEARHHEEAAKTRLAAATAAHTDATDARARLVTAAAAGAEIAPKAIATAETGIRAAEADKQLWEDARVKAAAAAAEAQKPVAQAQKHIAERQLAEAAQHRIESAEKLDQAAARFGAAYSAWLATADGIFAEHRSVQLQQFEIENLRDYRYGLWTLPAEILQRLAAVPNGTSTSVAARDRNAWGRLASRA